MIDRVSKANQVAESPSGGSSETADSDSSRPPVTDGEVREITIESLGDQGDGIAEVERGYVVIVPDAHPGDELTVRIDCTQENAHS